MLTYDVRMYLKAKKNVLKNYEGVWSKTAPCMDSSECVGDFVTLNKIY